MDACGKSRMNCDIVLCPAMTQRSFLFTTNIIGQTDIHSCSGASTEYVKFLY